MNVNLSKNAADNLFATGLVLCIFLGCGLFVAVAYGLQQLGNWLSGSPTTFAVLGPRPMASLRELSFEELERVTSAVVVEIESHVAADRYKQGSAVVVGPTFLLTACHVGEKNTVAFIPDDQPARMHLMGADQDSDRCVFTTDRRMQYVIPGVRLVSTLASHETIYVYGFPHDTPTLSAGVFTNVYTNEYGVRMIRTNARAAPGSSGGGLFDRYGNLIGILTSYDRVSGSSFALVAEDWWAPWNDR